MPHDALKELGEPPDDREEIVDPREELLEEARGGEPEPEPEETTEEEPLSEIDQIRAQMAEQERAIRREIGRERERRRRAVRKAEVLERQVGELIAQQTARETPTHVRLEHDDEGNPILSRDALARLQAPPKTRETPQPQATPPPPSGSNSYQRMKDSLVDEDPSYGDIFTRLEAATKDLARGLEEAAQDGETLNTADEVAEYLETSELGSDLKRRYPEIEDVDEFLRAVQSSRVARKMAERIHMAAKKAEKKPETPARTPAPDLTGAVRNRIREKANQSTRSRPTTEVVDGISLDQAAQMDPEQMLALPAATRERLKAALRKQFA